MILPEVFRPDSCLKNRRRSEEYSEKKAFKITGRIVLLLLMFTLITFIIHRVRTNQETALFKEKGYYNLVSVGDFALNDAATEAEAWIT